MIVLQLLTVTLLCYLATSALKIDFKTSKISELTGQKAVRQFQKSSHVRIIYFYKKNVKYLNIFLKELEKASEYLDLYGVNIGFCNCTADSNKDVSNCKEANVEKSVHTYRSGNPLLSLELDTMFDVNAIMSNVLQLVMLKDVPILQTQKEVDKFLHTMKGHQDVVFGHMKAIGTYDHRVFMEVAYAYNGKLKFVVCTDTKATRLFNEPPSPDKDLSTLWWIWTKEMSMADKTFHNIRYKGEISLTAIAKFAKAILTEKMFQIPEDGMEHPYDSGELPVVSLYYDSDSADLVYQKAGMLSRHYSGTVGILLINCDSPAVQETTLCVNTVKPVLTIQHEKHGHLYTMTGKFSTDNIASFMEDHSTETAHVPHDRDEMYILEEDGEDDGQGDYSELPPGLDLEAVERQDDTIVLALDKLRNVAMKLDLVPALTDKTFPLATQDVDIAVVFFYFPFDAVSQANLRMFGNAVDRLGRQTELSIARVNCYDWTDVCAKQTLSMHPTLRVFNRGHLAWDYQGQQDTQAMYAMLKLLQLSLPVHLDNRDVAVSYLEGTADISTADVSNITVIGLFNDEHEQEIQVFKDLAEKSRDRIMFVYSDSADAEAIAVQYHTRMPAVILAKYDDPIQPLVPYQGNYHTDDLQRFIDDNKLPKLGMLTPLMFPDIRQKFNDLLILFTDGSDKCRQSHDSVREIIKTEQFTNVSFNMMSVSDEKSVGYKVLQEYTEEPTVPHISIVRFIKGEVFNFETGDFHTAPLTKWLKYVMSGTGKPSSVLPDREWKPKNKGYEFLRIMDWEKERDSKKNKNKNEERPEGEVIADEVPTEQDEPVKLHPMEEVEDSDTRQELINLHKSRLYHQSAARGNHPKGQGRNKDAADGSHSTEGQGHSEGQGLDGEKATDKVDQNNNEVKQGVDRHDPAEL